MSEENTNTTNEHKFLVDNQYGTGCLPDVGDFRDYTKETLQSPQQLEDPQQKEIAELFTNKVDLDAVGSASLPKAFDFTGEMPDVRNQGSLGSCVAFAVDGIVSYYNKIVNKKTTPISTLYAYKKCRDLDNVTKGDTGTYLRTGAKSLVLYGWVDEKRYPYVQAKYDNVIPRDLIDHGEKNQALTYHRLDSTKQSLTTIIDEIKKYIVKKLPIMYGFSVYQGCINQANKNKGIVPFPHQHDKLEGGHAVVITGYNDDMVIPNSLDSKVQTKGAVKFRNSWSNRWGTNGYGWLPYAYFTQQIAMDLWIIDSLEFMDFSAFD